MLYLTKNVDKHTLYIFSKLHSGMSVCRFLLITDKIHLDLTVFMQNRNFLLNLQVRTSSYWLRLKKVFQVDFQTCRFY